jgi:hypothetical protein
LSLADQCECRSLRKSIEADLDIDGRIERIEINGDREQTLQIWRGKKLLWQGVTAAWKPWKIGIADVDGDGHSEIIVGVFKATKFFTKPHNCLFIYGFSGETAFPKWLGSSLSRPFTDFIFADLSKDGGEELIAMETTLEGRKSLAVYHWNSFGFTLNWRLGDWQTARLLDVENGMIRIEADGNEVFLDRDHLRSRS